MNSIPNKGDVGQLRDALAKMETDEGYFSYAPIAWDALSSGQREVLNQLLHTGPVFDGNIASKPCRDVLLEVGLATRCCFMGEDGYTAATYPALTVFKAGCAAPFKARPGSRG